MSKSAPPVEPKHREWFWGGQTVILGIIALISWGSMFIAAAGMLSVGVFRAPWFKDEASDQRLVFKGLIITVISFALFFAWSQVRPPRTLEQLNDLLSKLLSTAPTPVQLSAPATPTPTISLDSAPTSATVTTSSALTPTQPPSSSPPSSPTPTPSPSPTTPQTLPDEFLSYSSVLQMSPQTFIYYPPSEDLVRIRATLVFEWDRHIGHKQLVVSIPRTRYVADACQHVIQNRDKWAAAIEKAEAHKTENASADRYLLRRQVIISHASPIYNVRAEALRREGHKVSGPEIPYEWP